MMPLQALAEVTSSTETKVESVEPVVEENNNALEIGDEVQPEPVGEGAITIKRVGQWTGESSAKRDDEKTYTSENDIIDKPMENGGLLRGLAKQFLAWSDLPPKDNGVLAKDAKLFLPQDTVKSYQDYVRGMKAKKGQEYKGDENTIYAVYYEITGFDKPFNDFQTGSLGNIASQLANNINNNKVMINNSVKADDILKGTENDKVEETDKELKIIDEYKKTDDKNTINEVVLKSEFEMEWVVAMLAYRNQYGSSQLRPILSRNDFKRYAKNQFIDKSGDVKEENIEGFSTLDGRDAGYTYVDLNMDFGEDKELVIPEKLFLEFKSYSWRPLFAYGEKEGGKKEILNIFGVDGSSKGKNPDAFKDLVSKEDPSTKFVVETNNYRKITVRVVLRKWGCYANNYVDDRIEESDIPVATDGTRASELLSNMTLRVLGSADGLDNKNIVRITDARAKELADGEAEDDIDVKGSIKGHVFADAGIAEKTVPFFGKITIPLKSNTGIALSEAEKVLKLSYVHKKDEPQPEPQPEPKPEPQPEYNPFWPIYFGSTKKAEEVKEKEIHKAYIFGYTDKTVKGNGNLTRAEAAAMVTRLAGLDLSDKSKADYNDLQDGAWYLPNINAALKAGMIDATDNNLRPNDKITRGEFAKMLAAIDKDNDYVSSFSDIKGHKYEKEISKIDGNKRIEGYQDGTFKPDGFLTRAEAASFLNRMFNRVADDMAIEDYVNSIIAFADLSKNDWFYFEIVEATNTHELYRRGGSDKFERAFEKWTNVLN